MIGTDRKMQRATGPHAECVLIGKPRGGAELGAGDRQNSERFRAHRSEHGERIRSVVGNVEWRGWLKTLETRHPVVIRREALQELTAAP